MPSPFFAAPLEALCSCFPFRSIGRRMLSTLGDMPLVVRIAVGILVALLALAVSAPLIAPFAPDQMDLLARLKPPFFMDGGSLLHWLGTDELGRDLLSRVLFSIRLSLLLAFMGTLLGALIGTSLGFLAAHFGGLVNDIVTMLIDFTASLPFIIMALTILAFFGADVSVIILVMAFYGWDRYARLSRNLACSALTEGYAAALVALGASPFRIYLHHILPNIANVLVVNMTLNFPGSILLETSLSFLGVGVQPPMTSLGTLLGFGRDYLTTAWWIAVIPGCIIVMATFSTSLLGDYAQSRLDPEK